MVERPIDYSQIQFTNDHESLQRLGQELGRIACEIEKGMGGQPNQIQGSIDQNNQIFINDTKNMH